MCILLQKETNKEKKSRYRKTQNRLYKIAHIPIFVRQFQQFTNFIEQHRDQRSKITRSQIMANKSLTHRFKARIEAQLLLTTYHKRNINEMIEIQLEKDTRIFNIYLFVGNAI